VVRDVRDDLYGHMVYLPLKEYYSSSTGKMMSNMMNDVGVLSRLLASVIKDFLQQTFTIVGLLVVIFMRDWKLALIAMLVFPIGGLFIDKFGKRMRRITDKPAEHSAMPRTSFSRTLLVRIVKAFTMEDEKGKFRKQNQRTPRQPEVRILGPGRLQWRRRGFNRVNNMVGGRN
jgi:subfamily B ATP-binding cassette protein MsbA